MIEKPFYDLAHEIASDDSITTSTYLRRLVLEDLKTRGLLSTKLLEQIVLEKQ